MNQTEVLDIAREAVIVLISVGAPVMLVSLGVGLVIALFQALTQIQEMTLVFVPKIVAVILTMTLMGGWMLTQAVTFGERAFSSAAVINN